MKRYLAFIGIWAGTYIALTFTGEGYYTHYDLFQSLVALFLLFTSQTILKPFWWRKELGIVLTLQMFLNVGDAVYDWPPARYNNILDALNTLELAILLIFGIGTFVATRMKKHEPAAMPAHPAHRVDKAQKRIQANG